jgi:AraC-like DNA-binding protein
LKQAVHEGTVRVAPTRSIIDVLRAMDVDAETVLQQAGVDPRVFDNPDNLVSFASRAHLMAVCREVTACPHFGLAVGQRDGLSAFGLVGYLAMHSPDVESALRCLMRYLHLHVQGSGIVLEREGGWAFLGYEIYQPLADGADQLEDGALAAMFNALRELCGVDWGPTEIWFTHRKPAEVRPFRSFFQAPLRYDMPRAGIYFSARWLERSVRAADPELHRLLQKRIDELDAQYREDFPEQVRRVLYHALISHQASAEEVAALFSIHSRTLHRRLKSRGTSFRELLEESRYTLACQLLDSSNASLAQIADTLGYADARIFNRAFKRWSGDSPNKWRKAHAQSTGSEEAG